MLKNLTKGMAALGAAAAKNAKSKKKKNTSLVVYKPKQANNYLRDTTTRSTPVPLRITSSITAHAKHKPFRLQLKSLQLSVWTSADATSVYFRSGGEVGTLAYTNLAIGNTITTGTSSVKACLPPTLTNIVRAFVRYRVNSAALKFIPYAPTTVFGALGIAAVPDGSIDAAATYENVMSSEYCTSSNIYNPQELKLPYVKNFWYYTAPGGAAPSDPDEKLTAFCSLLVAPVGIITTAVPQFLGSIQLTMDIELDGLVVPATNTSKSASSSSESLKPINTQGVDQPTRFAEEESPVYVNSKEAHLRRM